MTTFASTPSRRANPQWTQPALARTPAGGLGVPRDIAVTVLFLAGGA
ncbi:hypothetical protein [Azospirillum sp. INR13]|nr:hypothetical protein [Azospirillum sp. INR13]